MGQATALKSVNGRLVSRKSKTGNPACSMAMSQWKRYGMTGDVAKTLAKCRAAAAQLRSAGRHRSAGREALAQTLETRSRKFQTPAERQRLAAEKRAERAARFAAAREAPKGSESTPKVTRAAGRGTAERLATAKEVRGFRKDVVIPKTTTGFRPEFSADAPGMFSPRARRQQVASSGHDHQGADAWRRARMRALQRVANRRFPRGGEARKKLAAEVREGRKAGFAKPHSDRLTNLESYHRKPDVDTGLVSMGGSGVRIGTPVKLYSPAMFGGPGHAAYQHASKRARKDAMRAGNPITKEDYHSSVGAKHAKNVAAFEADVNRAYRLSKLKTRTPEQDADLERIFAKHGTRDFQRLYGAVSVARRIANPPKQMPRSPLPPGPSRFADPAPAPKVTRAAGRGTPERLKRAKEKLAERARSKEYDAKEREAIQWEGQPSRVIKLKKLTAKEQEVRRAAHSYYAAKDATEAHFTRYAKGPWHDGEQGGYNPGVDRMRRELMGHASRFYGLTGRKLGTRINLTGHLAGGQPGPVAKHVGAVPGKAPTGTYRYTPTTKGKPKTGAKPARLTKENAKAIAGFMRQGDASNPALMLQKMRQARFMATGEGPGGKRVLDRGKLAAYREELGITPANVQRLRAKEAKIRAQATAKGIDPRVAVRAGRTLLDRELRRANYSVTPMPSRGGGYYERPAARRALRAAGKELAPLADRSTLAMRRRHGFAKKQVTPAKGGFSLAQESSRGVKRAEFANVEGRQAGLFADIGKGWKPGQTTFLGTASTVKTGSSLSPRGAANLKTNIQRVQSLHRTALQARAAAKAAAAAPSKPAPSKPARPGSPEDRQHALATLRQARARLTSERKLHARGITTARAVEDARANANAIRQAQRQQLGLPKTLAYARGRAARKRAATLARRQEQLARDYGATVVPPKARASKEPRSRAAKAKAPKTSPERLSAAERLKETRAAVAKIDAAERQLTDGRRNVRVRLADLRERTGLSREQFDRAMQYKASIGKASLYGLDDPIDIKARDRAAAIRTATGLERHIAYFGEGSSGKADSRQRRYARVAITGLVPKRGGKARVTARNLDSGRATTAPALKSVGGHGSGPKISISKTRSAIARLRAERDRLQKERDQYHAELNSEAPGTVRKQLATKIDEDAPRFQYKLAASDKGEVGSLAGVRKWDENKSGVIQVWKDPENGKTYVVNGHNRLALAKRMGVENVTVRYLRADNAIEARQIGALTNIAEGRGTAIDAAKFLRDSKITNREMLEEHGIPLKEVVATQGLALSRLSQPLFQRVIDGDLPIARAATIGDSGLSHADQGTLMKMVDKRKDITDSTIREFITDMKASSQKQGGFANLFGDVEAVNTGVHRAELAAYVKKRLAEEKNLFRVAARKGDKLEEAGSQINRKASGEISQSAAEVLDSFDRLRNVSGPMAKELNHAAEEVASSPRDRAKVREDLYKRIREIYRSGQY